MKQNHQQASTFLHKESIPLTVLYSVSLQLIPKLKDQLKFLQNTTQSILGSATNEN